MTESILSRARRLFTTESQAIDRFFVGLAALVYCVFAIWLTARNSPWIAGDSVRYLELSQAILKGQFGLMHNGVFDPEAWRQPGYPAFLALGSLVFGKSRLALIILQHGMSFASILLVYAVARREISHTTARIFLILCSIYPFIAEATSKFLTESLCLFLISAAIYAISVRRPWSPYVVGVCGALAGLVRPNLMLLPIIYAIGYLLVGRQVRKAVVVGVVAMLALLPWSIRNYERFGRFSPMPVATGTGSVLMNAYWETRVSTDALYQYVMYGRTTPELEHSGLLELQAAINSQLGARPDRAFFVLQSFDDSPHMIAADNLLTHEAVDLIKGSPLSYLSRTLKNTIRMWFSASVASKTSPLVRYPMMSLGISTWLLGLIGLMSLTPLLKVSKSEALIVLCTLPVYFTLTLCWFQQDARYTVPGRLALLSLASYAIVTIPGAYRRIVTRHLPSFYASPRT